MKAVWAVVLVLIGALEFVPSYSGATAALLFTAAAIVPFALVRLGILVKLGAVVSAVVVIVLAVALTFVVLRNAAGGGGLSVFTDAVPRLLTTVRPAPAEAALLAPAALLVALVSTLVAVCVLGLPAGTSAPTSLARVGGVVAPALGAAVLYVAAQLLDAGRADPHGFVAVSLLAVVFVSWSTPYRHGSARANATWTPAIVAPAVAVIVVALAVAAAVPTTDRYDPRRHVTPPSVSLTDASPLSLLSGWTHNPGVQILTASVAGTNRLRLATMSTFTGDAWDVDDSYSELDSATAPDLPTAARVQPVAANVTITRLGGLWAPSPGGTGTTTLPGALVDRDDGGLARADEIAAGLSYSATGQVAAPTQADLQAAAVPADVPARYLAVPNLPGGLGQYARDAVRGASSPFEEAVALENAVMTQRRVSPKAPSGNSYARLVTFLFARDGRAGAQVGTSEQFATAFAVLARAVGLPTRVVVGFVVPSPGSDGRSVVRGANAEAWPEVYLGDAGWVPFEPTPGGGSSGDAGLKQSVLKHLKGNAGVVTPPKQGAVTAPPTQAKTGPAARGDGGGWTATAVVALVVGVLVVLLLLLIALRAVRRGRHRRAGPVGAWAEVLDLLVLLGRPASRHQPAPEIADALDQRLGRTGSAQLVARAADRMAFAPAGSSASGVETWRHVRVLRRRARSQLRWYRRAGFDLDPRPLLRR